MMKEPRVWCAKHAKEFHRTSTEHDDDGTQVLVKQYWKAACGCELEITMAFPMAAEA